MTTPRSPDTSRTRIFISFIILPDYEDEDTTLPIRSALLPPLPLFKEMEHDIRIPQDDIGLSHQEIVALCAIVETLDRPQTYRILKSEKLKITELHSRVEIMPTTGQGISSAKIKHIVAQCIANAIEAIAIYKTKSLMVHDLMDRVIGQGAKVAKNASNKKKWEGLVIVVTVVNFYVKHFIVPLFIELFHLNAYIYVGILPGRVSRRTGDQDGQGGDRGIMADGVVDEVLDFSTVITQQLKNLLPTIIAKVGSQASNIKGDVRNVNVNNGRGGCSCNEFLAYHPKDYHGKGGAIAYTRWTEKIESVQDMSGCGDNQKIKYTASSFIGKALTWWNTQVQTMGQEAVVGMTSYTDRFHKLARLVPHLVTFKNKRIDRNGSSKKNTKKRGNGGKPSRYRNVRDDNKISRTESAFSLTTNPVRKEYTSSAPKCTNCNFHHYPEMPCRTRNNPNQAMAIEGGQGSRNNGNRVRGRGLMIGANEARQDPNIVMGTFTLNNQYATTLFDYGADYSFVSTNFIPMFGIEPSHLGLSFENEIASGQLVEINKVIRGFKLEIKGHTFDIDLIPFGHKNFNVIVRMDWLSRHKAEIVFHEKIVRIPLPHGEMLRFPGERPKRTSHECESQGIETKRHCRS
uniref:Reverse transcriptase domain-containing protein n=1 Tax=Tanacetum cinerariifolium TaxID=118510 RepID=A0A6L2KG21_TANCI|nr:hypothetical protein [Tanacetum cinerariifolium]